MNRKKQQVREHVTAAVPTADPGDTVNGVLESLCGRRFDSVNSVFVVDQNRKLLGAIPLTELYAAPRNASVRSLMRSRPSSVPGEVDPEDAASLAIREGLAVVPVVDARERFLGVFSAREIMAVLRAEHVEDLHHLAGIWHQSDAARQALSAPPLTRARYRLPWLIVGLAGSMMATGIVARFEEVLQSEITIAYFIPAIVYLADAVGTQSEAIAVRGLSLTQFGIGRLLTGKIAAGALMGLVLAVLAGVVRRNAGLRRRSAPPVRDQFRPPRLSLLAPACQPVIEDSRIRRRPAGPCCRGAARGDGLARADGLRPHRNVAGRDVQRAREKTPRCRRTRGCRRRAAHRRGVRRRRGRDPGSGAERLFGLLAGS